MVPSSCPGSGTQIPTVDFCYHCSNRQRLPCPEESRPTSDRSERPLGTPPRLYQSAQRLDTCLLTVTSGAAIEGQADGSAHTRRSPLSIAPSVGTENPGRTTIGLQMAVPGEDADRQSLPGCSHQPVNSNRPTCRGPPAIRVYARGSRGVERPLPSIGYGWPGMRPAQERLAPLAYPEASFDSRSMRSPCAINLRRHFGCGLMMQFRHLAQCGDSFRVQDRFRRLDDSLRSTLREDHAVFLAKILEMREEPIAGQNRGRGHRQVAFSLWYLDKLQALPL